MLHSTLFGRAFHVINIYHREHTSTSANQDYDDYVIFNVIMTSTPCHNSTVFTSEGRNNLSVLKVASLNKTDLDHLSNHLFQDFQILLFSRKFSYNLNQNLQCNLPNLIYSNFTLIHKI